MTITVGSDAPVSQVLALRTVLARSLHLLPHSHVDIGYSDPQPEVERKQWKNLRDAVDLARRTASYPPDARFRWNVEGLWSVESYLKQASPDDRQAFIESVRNGHDRPAGERREPPHRPGDPRRTAALDVGLAPPARGVRPRDRAHGHALRHPRPQLDVGGRPLRGRRALLQQRPELHARSAGRRRPHRGHAEGAGRHAVLVGVAVGRRAAALLDGRPRLFLVPRPQHGPHDGSQPRRRARVRAGARGCRLSLGDGAGAVHDRRRQRPGRSVARRHRKGLERAVRLAAARHQHGRRDVRGVRAEVRREAPRHGGRHDAVLGRRGHLERGGGSDGARGGAASRAGRSALGAAPARRVPGSRRQRGLAESHPLARTHVGRGRFDQPARPRRRRRAMDVQARVRPRGRQTVDVAARRPGAGAGQRARGGEHARRGLAAG